jgi:hypothetical protein
VSAVDAVHWDGPLPATPVVLRPLRTVYGRLRIDPSTHSPIDIRISTLAPEPELTLLHELGHLLDWSGIGTPGSFASDADPLLAGWRSQVVTSQAVKWIRSLSLIVTAAGVVQYLEGLLDTSELWARSYAQFVAIRSGDPTLLGYLDQIRMRRSDEVYISHQWDDPDFVAVGEAMDAVFRRLGWML